MAAFLVRANGYSAIGGDYFTDDEGSVFERDQPAANRRGDSRMQPADQQSVPP